ncbi:MAG: hypothetical protein JSR82_06370 [Verrucomicrobia bacterium]|nr:hypothetical protein [Verrucomicrobiota bacterium]
MHRIFWLIAILLLAVQVRAEDTLIETYTARLSSQDHFSSTGARLTTAAAIIRQDRANYHKFGKADAEDDGDSFFANAANREALEKMLERGRASKAVVRAIVNGTPRVTVSIWRGAGGSTYVTVLLLEE